MKMYHYIDSANLRQGPVAANELVSRGVNANTYVWCPEFGQQWLRAGDVEELKVYFAPQAPTPPSSFPGAQAPRPQAPQTPNYQQPGAFPGAQAPRPQAPQAPNYQQPGSFPGAQAPRPQAPQAPNYQQPGAFPGGQPPRAQAPNFPQPGYQQPQGYAQPAGQQNGQKPDNYLVWAILCTICCCLPGGIVSIIYSTKVDNLWNSGQYQEAYDNANKAKTWAMWSAIAGVAFEVIYIIIMLITGALF